MAKRLHGLLVGIAAIGMLVLAGCAQRDLAPADAGDFPTPAYRIGPGDNLNIFVWRNPELSVTLPVRPDGRLTVPLIDDVPVAGKTPTELARDLEVELAKFIQDPIVSVLVTGFQGPFDQQIRVVGEAARPQGIPYRENMSILDVMIAVGGLTEFAAGNDAVIVRQVDGSEKSYRVRLDDLVKDGDVAANVEMLPGDVLIIPQSWF
ncbi:MAG: polysaccharide export protein [Alphaproteobacteria bacterium]